MSYEIISTSTFLKSLKRLKKKYPSIKNDILELSASLEEDPFQGVEFKPSIYKLRFAIKSKGRGKSSGGHLISIVRIRPKSVDSEGEVHLISVYDKSDASNITDSFVVQELNRIVEEE